MQHRAVQAPRAALRAGLRDSATGVRTRLTFAEVVVATAGLAILAFSVFGPHIVHGGFLEDDWANYSIYHFHTGHGFWGALSYYLTSSAGTNRPIGGIYGATAEALLGFHMGWWLAAASAFAVALGVSVYTLLRQLRFGWVDAFLVAALLIVFPGTDSLRLWSGGTGEQLAVALAIVGFGLALAAFRARTDVSRWLLHAASLTCYVLSILFAELALALLLVSVFVYRFEVPWRAAARRWLIDLVIVVPIVLFVTSQNSTFQKQSTSGQFEHVKTIWRQSRTFLAENVLPLGSDAWIVLLPLALVIAVGIVMARALPPGDAMRSITRYWLLVIAGGLAVVVLGYAVYVPAIDYYNPLTGGIANRVNLVSSIGWLLIVYGVLRLACALALARHPRAQSVATVFVIATSVILGANYIHRVRDDARRFDTAYSLASRTLATIKGHVPPPPEGSRLYIFGQPIEVVPSIPVFGNDFDMTGAIRVTYNDPSLTALPGFPDLGFTCTRRLVVPTGHSGTEAIPGSPYGRTLFVDGNTGYYRVIRDRKGCLRASAEFNRSPPVLGQPPAPGPPARTAS